MTAISRTRDQLTEELARVHRLIDELIESASENIHNIEDAIKGSEEHYRHLVENAHDVLWVFDLGLGYTYISPSVKRLRGYTVDEAMKLHIEQVLTPQSLEKARALIEKERLLESAGHRHGPGWFYTDEFEMYRKDGSTFWAEVTMNFLYDDKGAIRGVMGITRDISERKRAEEDLKSQMAMLDKEVRARTEELTLANERLQKEINERSRVEAELRESMEMYRIHFSLANDVMFSYDSDFRVLSVTPNVERVLGYTPEELVGKTFYETKALHPDSFETALKNASYILSGNPVYSSVYKFIRKDGTVGYGEVSGVPCMKDGRVYAVTTIARDVTDRVEMANVIAENEQRYRSTLESIPLAVCIIRLEDLRFLYANREFSRITSYSPEEVTGRTFEDLGLTASDEDRDHCIDLMRNARNFDSVEKRCRKKDGSVMDTMISARPIHYAGHECIVMVLNDITALRQVEEERTRLKIQSQKLEAIATLASGIAHDFNNILTTIIGYTKMSMKDIAGLSKGDTDVETVKKDLDEVRKASQRAQALVNHILAFSRHAEADHVPIDLADAIEKSLEALRPTLPSNIKLRQNLSEQCLIQGDRFQIPQVVTNLCTNAIQAMEKTGGELEVSLHRVILGGDTCGLGLDPGEYALLSVRDTGSGMSEQVATRIFDPYFTTKWKGQGAGLGLSIAYGIVKSHGGAITLKTVQGKGTTFEVYFPAYSSHDAEAASAQPRTAPRVLDLDREPLPQGRGKTAQPSRKHKADAT